MRSLWSIAKGSSLACILADFEQSCMLQVPSIYTPKCLKLESAHMAIRQGSGKFSQAEKGVIIFVSPSKNLTWNILIADFVNPSMRRVPSTYISNCLKF